jgi:tetratricopeptide (TPR) repeat protein
LWWCGEFAQAVALLEESLAIQQEEGDLFWAGSTHRALVGAQAHLAHGALARAHARAGLDHAQRFGIQGSAANALLALSWVALAEREHSAAAEHLAEATAIYRQTGRRSELAQALACTAYVDRALDQRERAQGTLREAIHIALDIGAFHPLAFAVPVMALLLCDTGQPERAVELYAVASQSPFVANSQWFEDVAGKHIAAAAQALPPGVVAAAQERGRARDLWDTARDLLAELEAESSDPRELVSKP